ncbi:MAG TPA: helix-turn-helix transcriptional regulator [Candidatus Sulfotelmatobacter sp.]|nr:helix-turn-helix transcriptional regulator [Candidatus Sulfotelmatobacter sp.]
MTITIEKSPIPGRSTDPAHYQDVGRPIAAMAKDFPDGFVNPWHRHKRAQLLFATSGVMTVETPDGTWLVPPHAAVWVPARVMHQNRMAGTVRMRTLYVRDDVARALPAVCTVFEVSPLLRELILRAVAMPIEYDEAGPDGRIMALVLDEMRALRPLPLHLRMPADPRLQRVCGAIVADPGGEHSLASLAGKAGASARTLLRLFRRETGQTFAAWRQQARLLEALTRLGAGQAVTAVALDLGYDSPSAFTAMFRRALGTTPSRYLQRHAGASEH